MIKDKVTNNFYEDWAQQQIIQNYTLREMTLLWKVKVFAKLIPGWERFRTLLDIGCAEGILAAELSKLLNIEFPVGIDISLNFIRLGKKNTN